MIDLLVVNTATTGEGDQLFRDILPWLGVILLLVVILVMTIYIGRRMVRGGGGAPDQPFTLQSLRDLHTSGQLSDEEFQRARDATIGRVRGPAASVGDGDDKPESDVRASESEAEDGTDTTDDEATRPNHADNKYGEEPKGDSPG